MAIAAVVDLCEQVTAAINAASTAGAFARTVAAEENYSLTLDFENVNDEWTVAVQPGPSRTTPATTDGAVKDEVAARVVMFFRVDVNDAKAIKAALLLAEQILEQVVKAVESLSGFLFISSEYDGDEPYDADMLRNDGVFHSSFLISFDSMRDAN